MKFYNLATKAIANKVAPARGRGLKCRRHLRRLALKRRPRKGAWIEISRGAAMLAATVSPPQGGVD